MAITQQRVIAILNAAIDYRQAFLKLTMRIDHEFNNHRHNPAELAQAFETIYLSTSASRLLEDITTTEITIKEEFKHFTRHSRRNAKIAEQQKNKRRREGVPERPTAKPITGIHIPTGQVTVMGYQPDERQTGGHAKIREWDVEHYAGNQQGQSTGQYNDILAGHMREMTPETRTKIEQMAEQEHQRLLAKTKAQAPIPDNAPKLEFDLGTEQENEEDQTIADDEG